MEFNPKPRDKLRTGFTTGTCASAASIAALFAIIHQKKIKSVDVILPKHSKINIKIASCQFSNKTAKCSVIKDAGDDPDVTHGAEIFVDLTLTDKADSIEIDGGEGVGRITKPGLGLEIGAAAINPVPKKMIKENVSQIAKDLLNKKGIKIIITVPKGKELAVKTDNPRLGIIDGISILGTSGIVIPYSTASFAASIRQALDVTVAMKDDSVVLTTGGRSEDFSRNIITLPEHCFIQMGDFSGYAIEQCAKKKIRKAYVVGFIGKFSKIATGVKQTHVKGSKVDMNFLAKIAQKYNADKNTVEKIKKANTARHVLEIVSENKLKKFFDGICSEVYKHLRDQSEMKVEIDAIMFDFDGNVIGRHPR